MKIDAKTLFVAIILAVTASPVLSQEKASSTALTKPASPAKQSTASATNAATPDFPIIGYIEKRDRTITIKSGPKETIYSVKSADGKLLCNNLTLEQLRAQSPELHEFVKTAVAGNISNGATADSRIRVTDGPTPTKVDGRIR